jgi:GNAT superfamily N-acetyltransferase
VRVDGSSGIAAHIFSQRGSARQADRILSGRLGDEIRIRDARQDDVELIFRWIVELAEYERAREHVTGTVERLHDSLFGRIPAAEAVIAELGGDPAGFALYFRTFSTWLCQPGLWLEDLYVRPEHRRAGVGGELLGHLARVAVARGYGRLEWSALDWNVPALRFYESLGAIELDEWKGFRLTGDALERVAAAS